MKCREARRLLDAPAGGRLAAARAADLDMHLSRCERCREAAAKESVLAAVLSSATPIRAPQGFADRVMDRVYRQALTGAPVTEEMRQERREETARESRPKDRREARGRVYRRLGVSFVVSAAVLAISLLVPSIAYPGLLAAPGAQLGRGSTSVVRGVMAGATDAVRGALGESTRGGERQ